MGKAAIPFGSQTKLIGGNTIVAANGRYITLDSSNDVQNLALTASVAASALTLSLKTNAGTNATTLDVVNTAFRDSGSTTGTYNVRVTTGALSITVSSGSTLGQTSAVAGHLYVYLIDNAGTPELAISSTLYPNFAVVSTTAEGGAGAADSATVIYSATARTNVPIKVITRILQTQATAGTWTSITQIALGNYFPSVGLWTPYTSTLGAGYGTTSAADFKYRRNWQQMEIIGRFTAGTTNAGSSAIGLPAGYTIDTNAIAAGGGVNSVAGIIASGFGSAGLAMDPADVNNLYPTVLANIDSPFAGNNQPNGSKNAIHAFVPIAEWTAF